jgi:hypothetical protein
MARPGSWHHERSAFAPIENYGHRMSVARLYSQTPQWAPRDHRAPCAGGPDFVGERSTRSSGGHEGEMSLSKVTGPPFWSTLTLRLQMANLKCDCRRRGSQGRVLATGNEGTHRAHSGNPAFRSPSINNFAFDFPPRAIHEVIVKVGSTSNRRAAASLASALRPRWAKADARQQ